MPHRSDRKDRHMAEKSEHSHTFWYALCLVRIKNLGPLRFKLTRSHCIFFVWRVLQIIFDACHNELRHSTFYTRMDTENLWSLKTLKLDR